MQIDARICEFQTELRNRELTLEDVIAGKTDSPFFKKTMQIVRARRYQRNLYQGFESARTKLCNAK